MVLELTEIITTANSKGIAKEELLCTPLALIPYAPPQGDHANEHTMKEVYSLGTWSYLHDP